MTTSSGITASSLCARLIDGPDQILHPVHRSDLAIQLADDAGHVVMCVTKRAAIRLPHVVVVPSLPSGSSPVSVGGGTLGWGGWRTTVSRWWQPARPTQPALLRRLSGVAVTDFVAGWSRDIGLGEGLTPFADDVVCGGLVLLRAADHPGAEAIASQMREFELERRTTATSAALLRFASDGWCIDQLANYLSLLARAREQTWYAERALRDVGHSSGAGLLAGVQRLMRSEPQGATA